MHSINYFNALITPSEDCRAVAKVPDKPGSIAHLQYEMLQDAPMVHQSDDVLVTVVGTRKEIPKEEWDDLKNDLFSKGQPCFRTSPLVKTHGWGLYHDSDGRVGLVDPRSDRFQELLDDPEVTTVRGMRNARR